MPEYKYTLEDKAGNVWLDTRGSGLRMHGTSSALDKLYEDAYSTMNIYGQGFYTSDARDIAEGYTKKGKGSTPSVYEAKERNPVKLFDLDAPLSKEHKAYFADLFGELADEDEVTLRDFYDNARGNSRYAGYSADDVQEIFYSAQDKLAEEGYGGFQHVGGDKTNNKPHKVRIYWDAANQLDLEELAKDAYKVGGSLFDVLKKASGPVGVAATLASMPTSAGEVAESVGIMPLGEGSDYVPLSREMFIDQFRNPLLD